MNEKIYDAVIIGAGPAGLSAGIYAARAKMDVIILEKERTGGQIVTTEEIANYPGAVEDETGPSLISRMVNQVKSFGAEVVTEGIVSVDFSNDIKIIKGEKNIYNAKSVIIATGAKPRILNVPGEKELTGRGVSYCATCDGDFFTGLEIFAIGGGDTALEEAMFLTKFAKKVTVVHRRDKFRAAKSIVEKASKNEKIEFLMNKVVDEVLGEGVVEGIVFKDTITGELTTHMASEEDMTFGVFVFVGYIPQTEIFKEHVEMDQSGYISTNELMMTNIPGVYAAGDIRPKSLRQVVTAVSDGAIAAVECEKYIEENA
ncbi:MAG: thioredoxin-disulfide reductase [Clostridiales bacterium]|nr:thioredoxin-disulfide reductase [Clostridiales bacterium]